MPQPYKGLRKAVGVRMPMKTFVRLSRFAAERGLTLNDAAVICIEEALRSPRER